jgi:DNA replication protein DnaC
MAGRRNLPDMMGEALGRVRIAPRPPGTAAKVVKLVEQQPERRLPVEPQRADPALINDLKKMRLTGMAQALERQVADNLDRELGFEQRLRLMLKEEDLLREQRRRDNRLSRAKLRYPATMAEVDYDHPRGLQRQRFEELAELNWLENKRNIIITGPVGVGKTWLACALARQACLGGHTALYQRTPEMLMELGEAAKINNQVKKLRTYAGPRLLILDDWGWEKLERFQALDLLEVVEKRHQRKSNLLVSPVPLDQWVDMFWNRQLGQAVVDRLTEQAEVLELSGPSLRVS